MVRAARRGSRERNRGRDPQLGVRPGKKAEGKFPGWHGYNKVLEASRNSRFISIVYRFYLLFWFHDNLNFGSYSALPGRGKEYQLCVWLHLPTWMGKVPNFPGSYVRRSFISILGVQCRQKTPEMCGSFTPNLLPSPGPSDEHPDISGL